jgi:hypothetical protein
MMGMILVAVAIVLAVQIPRWRADAAAKRAAAETAASQAKSEQARVDARKFEGTYRAAKALESGTDVGVNYQRFGELVQAVVTELGIASDKATNEREKAVLASYQDALGVYRDSFMLWKHKVEDVRANPPGAIYVGPEVRVVVDRYRLPVQVHTYPASGETWESLPENAIQEIWRKGRPLLQEANSQAGLGQRAP